MQLKPDPLNGAIKPYRRLADPLVMMSHGRAIALGAGRLFWYSAVGWSMFVTSAGQSAPYTGTTAETIQSVGLFFFTSTAVLYVIFHAGFALVGYQKRLPAVSIAALSTVAAPLALYFEVPHIFGAPLLFFGGALLLESRVLGRPAALAGALEFSSGVAAIAFGATPAVLLFMVAWFFKLRLLQSCFQVEPREFTELGAHSGPV